jgi:hypothetical protein
VPLAIIAYMDGCVMGQIDDLPIEALKFTLGIFNTKARDRACFWHVLGYVTKHLREKSAGEEMIRDSQHADLQACVEQDNPREFDCGVEQDPEVLMENEDPQQDSDVSKVNKALENELQAMEPELPACRAQDLHAMLETMLESYLPAQDAGIDWELYYRGRPWKMHFIPYVMFIKGDTVEDEKHFGTYNSRMTGVKQLC